MRACLFGTYNRSHSANRIYAAAARAAGYDLVELHEPVWEHTRDKDAAYFGPLGLILRGISWLRAAGRLARRWLAGGGAGVVVVGFNGQLDMLLLRLLTLRSGPHIVFAPLVSLTETLVDDRRVYRRGSMAARLLAAIDRWTCRLADVVVTDTQAHREYFIKRLGVDAAQVVVCHLGVDHSVFAQGSASKVKPTARTTPGKVEVLYFGQYLPLHGLDVIVDAVGRLASRGDLKFVFVGTGEQREPTERLARATRGEVEFVNWVDYGELPARIAQADIVLGIFGSSVKARMVIPNKVYEAASVGKTVITADTAAVREVFEDGRNMVLCQADGASLARAIADLAGDAGLRRSLGEAARVLMARRFSARAQGRAWQGPLGAHGLAEPALPLLGVATLNFNGAEHTLRCLESLARVDYPNLRVLVVDNASQTADRLRLEQGMAGRFPARVVWLEENRGYAGGNNLAMRRLFEQGCEYVLLLNNDTLVTPEALRTLVRTAREFPSSGPLGPMVSRDWPGGPAASLGERYWATLAWLPRSLLRYRRPRQRSYPVGGVMGCSFLVSRRLYEEVGELDEQYFAYYEEVDYCLRARRAGMRPRLEPNAEIAHAGHRGFGGGMTQTAAYLKARNLWSLAGRFVDSYLFMIFLPGYFAMTTASMAAYLLRGRWDIVRALGAGLWAALHGESGPPPPWVLAPEQGGEAAGEPNG